MSTHSETVYLQTTPRGSALRLLWVAPLAMVAASAANLGLYAAAGRLNPSVTAWPGAGPGQIVGATVVYLLLGALALAAIARFARNPARVYVAVATVGLLLSLALPLAAGLGYGAPGAPPANGATALTLSLMHVLAYAISVPMYVRLVLE